MYCRYIFAVFMEDLFVWTSALHILFNYDFSLFFLYPNEPIFSHAFYFILYEYLPRLCPVVFHHCIFLIEPFIFCLQAITPNTS